MRTTRRSRVLLAAVCPVFVAAAAVLAVPTVTGDGHPRPVEPAPRAAAVISSANLWVESGAGACARSAAPVSFAEAGAPDARCGSLDEAYDAAAGAGADTVALVRGTFPSDGDAINQVVTGDRAGGGRVTFDCAPGARCVFEGVIQFGDGRQAAGGGFPEGPDGITLRHVRTSTFAAAAGAGYYQHDENRFGVYLLGGTSGVRVEHVHQGGFLMQGVRDVEWRGGTSGPCMAPALPEFNPAPDKSNPCGLNKMDFSCSGAPRRCQTRRVLVEGLTVADFAYDEHCEAQGESGPDGCHHRSWYMNGVQHVTIRNSTFRGSVFEPWMTISGPDAGVTGNEDVLWENNQFGSSVAGATTDFATEPTYGLGGGATCWAAGQPSYRDITIRFNSFAALHGLAVPGSIASGEDDETDERCTVEHYRVYGNVFGSAPAPDDGCGNAGSAIEYRYNVYVSATPGTCHGPGEQHVSAVDIAFYAHPRPAPGQGDYALVGPPSAADDAVPSGDPAFPCPRTDAAGRSRPTAPGGACDAGAFER